MSAKTRREPATVAGNFTSGSQESLEAHLRSVSPIALSSPRHHERHPDARPQTQPTVEQILGALS